MSKNFDLIVVGSGLSGMATAAFVAKKDKKCALITKGSGTLTIGSGTIDVLGYLPDGTPIQNPFENFSQLPQRHPYTVIGEHTVKNALDNFHQLINEEQIPYRVAHQKNHHVVTAAGTTKPTWMFPESMDMSILNTAKKICILGIDGLKDFYPELIARGLSTKKTFAEKEISTISIPSPLPLVCRDLSALDLARYIDTIEGIEWLSQTIKQQAHLAELIIIPPIIGTHPSLSLLKQLEQNTGCIIREADIMPPSVTGYRLNKALRHILKKNHVTIIDNAVVTTACVENGHCISITTTTNGKNRIYTAKHFVIATGGIISDGILTTHNRTWEPIFNLDIPLNASSPGWVYDEIYPTPNKLHAFSLIGPEVDDNFRPVTPNGNLICDNVYFIGHILSGYDAASEKSGNGVAIATAYFAALNSTR